MLRCLKHTQLSWQTKRINGSARALRVTVLTTTKARTSYWSPFSLILIIRGAEAHLQQTLQGTMHTSCRGWQHRVLMGQLRCSSNCKLPKRSAAISSCSSTQQASYRLRPPLATDVPKLAAIEQLCGEFSANWSTADIQVSSKQRLKLLCSGSSHEFKHSNGNGRVNPSTSRGLRTQAAPATMKQCLQLCAGRRHVS